jgi:hypothetical protein
MERIPPLSAAHLWAMSASTSPQCQPTTDRKESNLGGIEHAVYKRYTSLTGKNHR